MVNINNKSTRDEDAMANEPYLQPEPWKNKLLIPSVIFTGLSHLPG